MKTNGVGNYDFPDSAISKGVLNIKKGKIKRAQRVVIYGPEGVGKSTLASQFPNPIFIDVEGSTSQLDCDRIEPQSYQGVKDALNALLKDPQGYKTIIIDTIDWLEQRMSEKLMEENHFTSIEDFGYGKGYTQLAEEMFRFCSNLSSFLEDGINIVLVSHSVQTKCELPDQRGQFDQWTLDLHKKVLPIVKEWADMILFINWRTKLIDKLGDKKGQDINKKAIGGTEGIIYATHTATYDAKNRHELPSEMPLAFDSIAHIFDEVEVTKQPVEEPVNKTAETESEKQDDGILSRILEGEKFLKENKVQHYMKGAPTVQRWNVTGQRMLEDMTPEDLEKWLVHLNKVAKAAGLIEEEVAS